MPSVEIICVGQRQPTIFENMPFRIDAENELKSQRTPSPLFQANFNALDGCIYHLIKQSRGACTVAELLDGWWEDLQFKPDYVPNIQHILCELLAVSPVGRVLFTSDYQYGPAPKQYKRPLSLNKFWTLHAEGKLRVNALYPLRRGSTD